MGVLLLLPPSAHPSWARFPKSLTLFAPHEARESLPCSTLAWGSLAQARAGRASGFPGRHWSLPATSSLTPSIPSPAQEAASGPESPIAPKGCQHCQGARVQRGGAWAGGHFEGGSVCPLRRQPLSAALAPRPSTLASLRFQPDRGGCWACREEGQEKGLLCPPIPRTPPFGHSHCRLHHLTEQVKCQAQTSALMVVCLSICLPPPLSEGGPV